MEDGVQHAGGSTDRVVREIDVCLSNGLLGTNTKMYLLQYPLRPPWRPYDLSHCEVADFKPNAKRLELTTALQTRAPNYNTDAAPEQLMQALTLSSHVVDLPASFAVGCLKGDKLVLSPLHEAVQMRPHMAYVNDKKQPEQLEANGEEKPLRVQARETERQTEQRVNSYAYFTRQEEEEKWKRLSCASADSHVASSLWNKLMSPPKEPAKLVNMERTTYLSALTPGTGLAEAPPSARQQGTHTGSDFSVTGQSAKSPATASRAGVNAAAMGATLHPKHSAADGSATALEGSNKAEMSMDATAKMELKAQLVAMFRSNSVVNLQDIRKWLKASAQGGLAETSASASDNALHNALLKTDVVTSVKQLYLQKEVASEPANALRGVLIGLLKEKPNVRRADVMDAARAEGVNISDGIYQKVMKDLCTSRGNIWTLKSGAQSL